MLNPIKAIKLYQQVLKDRDQLRKNLDTIQRELVRIEGLHQDHTQLAKVRLQQAREALEALDAS